MGYKLARAVPWRWERHLGGQPVPSQQLAGPCVACSCSCLLPGIAFPATASLHPPHVQMFSLDCIAGG